MPKTPDFYPPEFTDRSRSVLHQVHAAVPEAILIGGWATWLRTGGPMSHDIDLIITRPELAVLDSMTEDLSESRHLAGRKWRATLDGIHLDLYVPHQSRLGQHLQLRVERLLDHRDTIDDWHVLDLPGHVATKLAALVDRPDSPPGDKDRHELLALLAQGVDPAVTVALLRHASTRASGEVGELVVQAFEYLADLPLPQPDRRRLTQWTRDWTAQRQAATRPSSPLDSTLRRQSRQPGRGPELGR